MKKFILYLEQTVVFMQMMGENEFKIRAYKKGAEVLETYKGTLESLARGEVKVPGIGEGLRLAIEEYLQSGDFSLHRDLNAKIPTSVVEMTSLEGLGPKRAYKLFTELGITTLGELEYACKENRIATVKGFGPALQGKLLEGFAAMKKKVGKIRLDEAWRFLSAEIAPRFGGTFEPVGQVGRSLEIVDKIEVAVFKPNETSRVDSFEGPFGVPVEVHFFPELPGDKRAETLRGLLLPEAVRKSAEKYETWEPRWIESVWLSSNRKPTATTYRIERDGGVKGIFHCHTVESDGTGTLEEMVLEAQRLGYEYVGISDHSQSAVYAGGLKQQQLEKQAAQIAELQKKVSIRIFHGVESDILRDGSLDYDKDLLRSLDFVIASIHSRFQMKGPEMTERLVRALSNPFTTIWGHPTGRLLLDRDPYELDWEKCLSAASANATAVELNCNPQRLDVDWRLGAQLVQFGTKICVNPDAHRVDGIAETRFGEWMAEKAMIDRDQILNRKSVSEMEKFLWERKRRAA